MKKYMMIKGLLGYIRVSACLFGSCTNTRVSRASCAHAHRCSDSGIWFESYGQDTKKNQSCMGEGGEGRCIEEAVISRRFLCVCISVKGDLWNRPMAGWLP